MAEITHIGEHPKRKRTPEQKAEGAQAFLSAYEALCRRSGFHIAESLECLPIVFDHHNQPDVFLQHIEELKDDLK